MIFQGMVPLNHTLRSGYGMGKEEYIKELQFDLIRQTGIKNRNIKKGRESPEPIIFFVK